MKGITTTRDAQGHRVRRCSADKRVVAWLAANQPFSSPASVRLPCLESRCDIQRLMKPDEVRKVLAVGTRGSLAINLQLSQPKMHSI